VEDIFRPWYGRVLTILIGLVSAGSLAAVLARQGWGAAAQVAPWLALLALTCWATFWRPCVVVSDSGVRVVNVSRTIDVPWPALQAIETRWALTLLTAYGKFTAWAAPAPGVRAGLRTMGDRATAARADGAPLSRADLQRAGDLPDTPSGDAAALVQHRWRRLVEGGFLKDPRLERERAQVRWHVGTGAAALALLALGLLGLV
jgi:hypothetical protein